MKLNQIESMGMVLDQWTHKSCISEIGIGNNWATIYMIKSKEKGKGHASELIIKMKDHYESKGKTFGSSVALNPIMKHLLNKLNITEYL